MLQKASMLQRHNETRAIRKESFFCIKCTLKQIICDTWNDSSNSFYQSLSNSIKHPFNQLISEQIKLAFLKTQFVIKKVFLTVNRLLTNQQQHFSGLC